MRIARKISSNKPGSSSATHRTIGPKDEDLRRSLLGFIGDFANWDNSSQPIYLEVGRGLVKAAHGEEPPLVVDPFAGGARFRWKPCAWAARPLPATSIPWPA